MTRFDEKNRIRDFEQSDDRDIKRYVGKIAALDTLKTLMSRLPTCPVCKRSCSVICFATSMGETPTVKEIKARHAMSEMSMSHRVGEA
jgi:hypothetical protein